MSEEIVAEDADVEEITEQAELASRLPAVRASEAMVTRAEVTPEEVAAQRDKIEQVMRSVMKPEVHYGTIPGVNKPTLLKPGAEMLAVTFRLAPHYHSERIFHDDGHLTVVSRVTLTHIPSGLTIAEGEGLCTSREKKYAYRGSGRTCPECGESGTIRRSKFEDNGDKGWYCFAKIGGCGAKFRSDDASITSQDDKPVPNPDLPDTFNTVLKMANKRALVAAILNGTAASDIFTQDVEDSPREQHVAERSVEEERQPVRRDPEVKVPRSWAEILERMEGAIEDAAIWLGQAKELGAKLPEPTLFQRLCGVVVDTDGWSIREFPPRSRHAIQEAFGKRLDGIILPGPTWALDGDEAEAGRPSKEDVEGPSGDGDAITDSDGNEVKF